MFKKLFLPLIGVMLFIILVGVLTQKSGNSVISKFLHGATPVPEETVTIGSKVIQVQIAKTQTDREKGLGGVKSLSADQGMFFVFDSKPVNATFWMKGMLIPLDMIWIKDNKVLSIDKNIPISPVGTPDSSLKTYSPNGPIDYVLEVNAGFSDSNGIKVGDVVILPTL
jgi:uncharacterized membrane protein (UPF0127 family)